MTDFAWGLLAGAALGALGVGLAWALLAQRARQAGELDAALRRSQSYRRDFQRER